VGNVFTKQNDPVMFVPLPKVVAELWADMTWADRDRSVSSVGNQDVEHTAHPTDRENRLAPPICPLATRCRKSLTQWSL
jgi:hypothetical protein